MRTKTNYYYKPGLFIIMLFLALGSKVFGQVCTPDPGYTSTGIWPDTITNMDPACVGASYQMDFTVVVPSDTVVAGFLFIVDSTIITSVSGLPAGFSYTCNPSSCRFLGGTSGCFIVSGNPTVPLIGSYNVSVNITTYAHNAVLGNQFFPQSFSGYDLNIGNPPNVGTNSSPASCGMSDGMAWAIVAGAAPFTYLWNTLDVNDTLFNVPAGLYDVTVTDNIGCTATGLATIINPGAPSIDSATTTNPLCFGDTDGDATVFASGGSPGYSYSWTSGGSAATETNLGMGTYTVTVTDISNCQTSTIVSITTPSAIGTSTNVTPETCIGCLDGSATVNASGGTPGYTYSWAPSGGTAATANGLAAGNYTITVTDSLGCVATNTANVYSTASIDDQLTESWKIYPNPVQDFIMIDVVTPSEINTIKLYDLSGRLLIAKNYSGAIFQFDMSVLKQGTYLLEINNGKLSRVFKVIRDTK